MIASTRSRASAVSASLTAAGSAAPLVGQRTDYGKPVRDLWSWRVDLQVDVGGNHHTDRHGADDDRYAVLAPAGEQVEFLEDVVCELEAGVGSGLGGHLLV
ncbi:hypothetical protein HPO96_13950 [Kribbella sandramycini]|uniref:Uncharacterized protein n=1 Tax=Kribbella sandramycini TaxID=60450 RepID=A0A7Y4L0S2_9ACTN|nr:hypothetical protein [Kribbella sandramycini]MBB6565080.1 hypothetical protein [Kribbella sandramycini]NOL41351.1 hypothetical protein [Kribbella sandramycini]